MNAIALTGLRKLEQIDVPTPTIQQDNEVLLRIETVGVCGSDMHYYETGRIAGRAATFPFIIGHECCAKVVEVGASVRRVKVGDRVAVDPAMSCFQCDQCTSGRPHTCRQLRFLGCPGEAEGCLCEFVVMPEASLYPVPNGMTANQTALCEPLSIGIYAAQLGRLTPESKIAILGSGPIGLCVMLAARRLGVSTIFMTDRIDHRVETARKLGATWAGNPDTTDVVSDISQQAPRELDAVFECAGQQETLDQAVALLKPGGRLAIVGIPREDRISFAIDPMRRKELLVVNVRRQNECVQTAVDAISSGEVKADPLATHEFSFAEAPEAFELVAGYRDGVIKAMIHLDG